MTDPHKAPESGGEKQGASFGSGSRRSDQAASHLDPAGFDPLRKAPPELAAVAEAIYETRRRMHDDRAPFRELYPSASRPYLEEAAAAIEALSRGDELRPSEKDPALGYRVLIFDLRKTSPSRMTQERAAQAIEMLCARLKLVTLERDAIQSVSDSSASAIREAETPVTPPAKGETR